MNEFVKGIKNYIKLIRVRHWIKNLLIFLALVFSGELLEKGQLFKVINAFCAFSLMASIIYIINDIRDRENDKKHKTKCKRPIASGAISVKCAVIYAIILMGIVIGIIVVSKMNKIAIMLMTIYFILNLAYSLGLKNVPLIDLLILVSGFIIRVMLGGVVIDVKISNWLFLTVLSMSFYLGLGKRRGEIIKNGNTSRKVLQYYSKEYLDKSMIMFLTMTIIFYSLWVIGNNLYVNENMLIWTIPLVITIVMKYSMNIESVSDGDPIEVVYKDKTLILLIFLYVIFIIGTIYLGRIIQC